MNFNIIFDKYIFPFVKVSMFGLGVFVSTVTMFWFRWLEDGSLQKLYDYSVNEYDLLSMGLALGMGLFMIIYYGYNILKQYFKASQSSKNVEVEK